ncbi:MAG: nicotinate-nucleotide adenylyltransferase [Lentisphaeria bacterium]|nr:nicotinate-nucleotide adenylyltransferase [Lentisphaeria bacterium]
MDGDVQDESGQQPEAIPVQESNEIVQNEAVVEQGDVENQMVQEQPESDGAAEQQQTNDEAAAGTEASEEQHSDDDDTRPYRRYRDYGDDEPEEEEPLPYARKPRVAIFGGSFDPIHNGHLMIAQKILELEKADEILFVPALMPPHKMNGLCATPEQRMEMVRLAIEPYEKFSVTDVELNRKDSPSYTFDTMMIMKNIYPDSELCLILGMDSLLGLSSWYRATELVSRNHFIIYPRPGVERPPIHELEAVFGMRNAYKLTDSILNDEELAQSALSSTMIREAARNGQTLENFVPPAVAEYIRENHIYVP